MNEKDSVSIWAIITILIVVSFQTVLLDDMRDKTVLPGEPVNITVITNPYPECIKGYCSSEGFKCLDEPTKPFTINNASCQCNEKGYACSSS